MSIGDSIAALGDEDLQTLAGVALRLRDEDAADGKAAMADFWAELLGALVIEQRQRRRREERLRQQVDCGAEPEDLDDSEWTPEPPAA